MASGNDRRVDDGRHPFAALFNRGTSRAAAVLALYAESARAAQAAGLEVNAGHDLSRDNLSDFLRAVPGVLEVSIGHALIADALEFGLPDTVRAYQRCIQASLT